MSSRSVPGRFRERLLLCWKTTVGIKNFAFCELVLKVHGILNGKGDCEFVFKFSKSLFQKASVLPVKFKIEGTKELKFGVSGSTGTSLVGPEMINVLVHKKLCMCLK